MEISVGKRVRHAVTGKVGKVVFISPINHLVYVEFNRQIPFVLFQRTELTLSGDLFGTL